MEATILCRHCDLPLTPTEEGYECKTVGCAKPGRLDPSGGAGVVIIRDGDIKITTGKSSGRKE